METKSTFIERWNGLQPKLKNFVYTKVHSRTETNDILQDVFIKAYTNLHKLRDYNKFDSWVFSIARNEINIFFNTQKKIQLQIPENELEEVLPINTIIDECAAPFLNALPQKYGEALRLVYIEKLSQKELAKRLNISYSGAKSRVQRGKQKLKELIEACCAIEHDSYGNILGYTRKKDGYCPVTSVNSIAHC